MNIKSNGFFRERTKPLCFSEQYRTCFRTAISLQVEYHVEDTCIICITEITLSTAHTYAKAAAEFV